MIHCVWRHRNTPPEELVKVANRIRLRSVANADLYTAVEPFSPVLDGSEFTFDPIQYFENGGWHGNEKNVILGTNIDEMAFISAYIPKLLKISYEKFEVIWTIHETLTREQVVFL